MSRDGVPATAAAATVRAFEIGALDERVEGSEVEVSAELDGERLWFRFPAVFRQPPRGDAFLATALLPAMRLGRPIVVDGAIRLSPVLLERLARLQQIFRLWFPWASPVVISGGSPVPAPTGEGTGALFSGGVDSSYTLLDGSDSIDHLLFVDRVDTGKRPERATYERVLPRMHATAAAFGTSLAACATSAKEFGHLHGIDWHDMMGGAFTGLAMLMGLRELRFPSSATWADLAPSGSHPVTDPIWATEGLTVIHHGAGQRRIEKLEAVLGSPELTGQLRVCMQGHDANCGRCEKCLRTMAGLRALGRTGSTLPPLDDLRPLRRLRIRSEPILIDWLEIAAHTSTRDPELAVALNRLIRRHRIRAALRSLRDALRGQAAGHGARSQ